VSDPDGAPPLFPTERTAVLTAHFGDLSWVALLVDRVRSTFPEIADERIYVIDQDRTATSQDALRARLGNVQILSWPKSPPHFVATGHDHAHALNLAVSHIDCDYLMLFDSDAHPVQPGPRSRLAELLRENDALLASRSHGTESLPCFMVFGPRVDRSRLRFDEDQLEHDVDTGRRIFRQLTALGLKAELLRPRGAFGGRWGSFYLDGTVYHHRSASFAGSEDWRLQAKFTYWRRESEFFDRRVLAGRYELSRSESLHAAALAFRRRAPEQAGAFARRLLGRRLRTFLKRRLRA
jgi:hypothetical protein